MRELLKSLFINEKNLQSDKAEPPIMEEAKEAVALKTPKYKPKIKELKVGTIMDEFMYHCLKHEFHLFSFGLDDWKSLCISENIDILLVLSAWNGNQGKWKNEIHNLHKKPNFHLKKLVSWCKSQGIPTVFWNKEDPYHFERFIEAAKLFDHVFTTDINCIKKYLDNLGHRQIHLLTFGAQPKIHNPINKDKEKIGKIGFAGTWYRIGHEDRKRDMEIVLKPALKYNPHIYDRMHHYTKSNYYKFPDTYQPFIQGSVPYEEMCSIYKKYDVFLNVNTIRNSPTMFSARVFELLSCGTNVISCYSLGIEKLFSNIVKISNTEEDTENHLKLLLNHKEIRERLSLLGQRKILQEHTYEHRITTLLDNINFDYKKEDIPGVSVITCINHPQSMTNILENYFRQRYEKKELIIVLNNNSIDMEEWKKAIEKDDSIRVFQIDEKASLGSCLNFAVEQAGFEYISKFDEDHYYACEFIGDLMNAFKYTDAGIVGKHTVYAYLEGMKALVLRFPNKENQYVNFLWGSAFIMDKKIWKEIKFTDSTLDTMTIFFRGCVNKGFKLYSTDRFNYVYKKSPNTDGNTWKVEDNEFLRRCEIVMYTDSFLPHIEV